MPMPSRYLVTVRAQVPGRDPGGLEHVRAIRGGAGIVPEANELVSPACTRSRTKGRCTASALRASLSSAQKTALFRRSVDGLDFIRTVWDSQQSAARAELKMFQARTKYT